MKKKKRKKRRVNFYTFNTFILRLRKSSKYSRWRKEVIQEQGKRCQLCNSKKNLQVHHIEPLAKIVTSFIDKYGVYNINEHQEELLEMTEFYDPLWDIDNGLVVCEFCHSIEHPTMLTKKERNTLYANSKKR